MLVLSDVSFVFGSFLFVRFNLLWTGLGKALVRSSCANYSTRVLVLLFAVAWHGMAWHGKGQGWLWLC
ncbi:uncharacterized protein K452DRAFT_103020 [Aplosporella prunicola CBS 121167]|uniref:Uncharacterized protein n=1 Tax=Aplosporella prunicola CBS 121167 TaxID=1176127 RepID=A0A6A6BR34_9PEZI|nr:uncharacterized protein K452DRAFT_103020 [Aplosporella prunicola CBS 121167]KAF2145903.1 hypothetical protein K452DRAFT_103020 [Aplosporella prunicola CBS 121167]